jgi:hypothetical protein
MLDLSFDPSTSLSKVVGSSKGDRTMGFYLDWILASESKVYLFFFLK